MDPGDVVVFHSNLFHKTSASHGMGNKARVALSLVAITEAATYNEQYQTSCYECTVKPRINYALEESGIEDGQRISDTGLVPELRPENAVVGPKEFGTTYNKYAKQSLQHMLSTVLLKCYMKRQILGFIPSSYEPDVSLVEKCGN